MLGEIDDLRIIDDLKLNNEIFVATNAVQTLRHQLSTADSWLQMVQDEQRLRTLAGGFDALTELRNSQALRRKREHDLKKAIDFGAQYGMSPEKIQESLRTSGHPEARVFMLGDEHTTHITKSQARKERKAYKLKKEADELEARIRKSKRKKK